MRLQIGSCILGFAVATNVVWAADPEFSFFTGRDVCLSCHASNGSARPCALEAVVEHDRAYEALGLPEAKQIAALCGEPQPPPQSRLCLGCHATSADEGPRWTEPTFDLRDGVQCEACHGAGSRHAAAYRDAGRRGELRGPYLITRGDRDSCGLCHVDRPSHEEVLVKGFRRRPADDLYKTPINVVVSADGQSLYVVCEHSNSIVLVDAVTGDVVTEIGVGQRPHDAAPAPDGRTLYVTNRLSGTLSLVDLGLRRVVGEIAVGSEPHGVVTDSEGRFVYVLNTGDDAISVIDADRKTEVKRLTAGTGPFAAAVSSDGSRIFVTNVRPQGARFRDPHSSEITQISSALGVVTARASVPDANMLQGVAFVPGRSVALFTLSRTKNLVPLTRLAQGWAITNGLGVVWPDGRVDQVLLDEPDLGFSDPMDVAIRPDGKRALVSSGGCDEVAVVDVAALLSTIANASDEQRRDVLPNHLGLSGRYVRRRVKVGRNPRGVAFSPDGRWAYVANALDDSITVLDGASFEPARVIRLGGPKETTLLRGGERLFHSAQKTYGRQFSCRSCHPDGHTNGLTFDIEADGLGVHPVDNRTLRGILDTPPFKWEGTNPTLHRQCGPRLGVFFTRLAPMSADELDALVRYIATIERPPNAHRASDGLTLSQRRGKAVFERSVTNDGRAIPESRRCIHCHNTPYRTARNVATVGTTMWFDGNVDLPIDDLFDIESFGELGIVYFYDTGSGKKRFDAPHLKDIFNGAPYLHNGAAPTLEEVWTRFNMYQAHGMTIDLTRRQFNDLIAYLKSL